jgi:hypothetical protein
MELGSEVLGDEVGAANRLAKDSNAVGEFGAWGEERKGVGECNGVRGGQGGEWGVATGGGEDFRFDEVEDNAVRGTEFDEAAKEVWEVGEGEESTYIVEFSSASRKRAKCVVARVLAFAESGARVKFSVKRSEDFVEDKRAA